MGKGKEKKRSIVKRGGYQRESCGGGELWGGEVSAGKGVKRRDRKNGGRPEKIGERG